MKNVLTPLEMKATDKNTEYNKIPTLCLMENAGAQIAHYIVDNFPDKKKVSIYSGTGGNGGDGFVIARHLLNYDYRIHLFLLARPENIKNKDSKLNWESLSLINQTDNRLTIEKITDSSQIKPDNSDIIVDAILGTGVKGKIREPTSSAIDAINYSPAIVLSVDVPSGLNPQTGLVEDKTVIPKTTLTLHKAKTGLIEAQKSYVGEIVVLDIGIPKISEEYVGMGDLLKIPQPNSNSHKGENGSVLIIGSNPDYIGAVVFAAQAALSQNIDLVYIAAPEKSATIIKQYNPEFIVKSLPGEILTDNDYELIEPLINKVDSILIGSGSGLDEKTGELFNKILTIVDKPIIIDADALKLVDNKLITKGNVVLTPHNHEFEVFFNQKLSSDFDEKLESVQKLSKEYNTVILLKGVTDIISSSKDYKLNKTGNQGMTVGGTGDLLAGLVLALSTKVDLFEAAYIASFILGLKGDEAFEKFGFNYTASTLLELL